MSAPEDPVSLRLPFIVIRDYSGDSLVMHTQAGGVAMATPPTLIFLNVLGQKVGVEKVGHLGSSAFMSRVLVVASGSQEHGILRIPLSWPHLPRLYLTS